MIRPSSAQFTGECIVLKRVKRDSRLTPPMGADSTGNSPCSRGVGAMFAANYCMSYHVVCHGIAGCRVGFRKPSEVFRSVVSHTTLHHMAYREGAGASRCEQENFERATFVCAGE